MCHLLGDYLEGVKKDFEKASKVYRSTCDDYGYSKSCLKYGKYAILGKGGNGQDGDPGLVSSDNLPQLGLPIDAFILQAYKYFTKGCDMNEGEACLHTGLILISKTLTDKVKRDVPAAFDKLVKSCELNNAAACFYLSGMHISGVPKTADLGHTKELPDSEMFLKKDMKKAFDFAYKSCELRNMYACANVSQMYARGDGTEKSEASATKYKQIAMTLQEELKSQQAQIGFQQGLSSS